MARHVDRTTARKNVIVFVSLLIIAILIAAVTAIGLLWDRGDKGKALEPGKLMPVQSAASVQNAYDVVVVGTDPEGVAAAVSAARNGQKTLLVDGRDREILGGLMTLGWLNSLDHNYDREKNEQNPGKAYILNEGIFSEWYKQVEGDSFDVVTAANAFYTLVKNEKNIDLLLKTKAIEPKMNGGKIVGVTVTKADGAKQEIAAKSVIDATQDADIAAAAGVPFTIGRADLGDEKSRMAVTLVFRLKNVTPDVWKQIQKRLRDDGDPNTDANERSAWGFGEMQKYPPNNKERVKMRGLNIGRQNDDTILINALQIFGIDGLDPKSREEAFEIGKKELPYVMDHMKKLYPEFAGLELDATAPELYIRETRHMQGEYRMTMIDVLENRDQWDRIGFGSYPVDIQRTSPTDNGAVMSHPVKYAIPFRSIVPQKVDNLLVVGRSASFDTLPHGSARVIPVGMATAEAAGAAAKLAGDKGVTFRQMSASKEQIAQLQDMLNKQGMVLKPYEAKKEAFMDQKAYPGLKTVVSMGLVIGGYDNSGFDTKPDSNPQRMVNLMQGVKRVNKLTGDPAPAVTGVQEPAKAALTLDQAAFTITKAISADVPAAQAVKELQSRGLLQQATLDGIADKAKLNNGDTYMMIRDLVEALNKK
ncbi:FAD-dependent oxidoreductase [Paenibacillus ginsengarvi]|uniref:FAD-dependent oxidoreductase n=1 Tax=Paenibacillus ginsengarvi TaxID=400777 RepID=A0A3B0CHC9_9BACL|nr:FAD-dependent oxidoreductase [Paenibacillus ginsengarvi]RKN83799.1 FAD-dependent oxidoreductase [Paenibacillus ginsengarvi]